MNKLAIVTGVVDLAVSAGAGSIVGNAVKATTPVGLSKFRKGLITVGSFALSGAVGSFASDYAQEQILKTAVQLEALKSAAKAKPAS